MSAVLEVREPNARYLTTSEPSLVQQFGTIAVAPGGVARLRELLLELAVQGRLATQDASDEPAGTLVQRIQALKAQGLHGSQRRTSAIVDSGDEIVPSAPLPDGWVWSTLAKVGHINPRNAADDSTIASFVQMSSIPAAFTDAHVSEPRPWREIKSGFTQFAEGDVGVAKITPCFENGKSTVFQRLHNGIGAGTTELHIVRPLCGIEPRYVLLFLKSPRFLRDGEAMMTGTAGQKRLPRTYFENYPFPLPPLAEQARIVARVDELMRLCDALEEKGRLEAEQHARLLSTLLGTLTDSATPEELAANWQRVAEHFDLLLDRPEAVEALESAILVWATRGLLVPQLPEAQSAAALLQQIAIERRRHNESPRSAAPLDESELSALSEGWLWCRVSDLGITTTGATPATNRSDYFGGEKPFIGPGQIDSDGRLTLSDRSLSELGCKEAAIARPNDILMVCIGGSIGKSVLLDREVAFNQQINCLRPLIVDPMYVHIAMRATTFQAAVMAAATGSATPIISRGKWDLLPVPLPPLEEQRRIVARVTELRRLCATLRERLQAQQATQSRLAEALVEQALA